MPAGCITRYVSIITRLADATHTMHPDNQGLQKAKAYIQHFQRSVHEKYVFNSFVNFPIYQYDINKQLLKNKLDLWTQITLIKC